MCSMYSALALDFLSVFLTLALRCYAHNCAHTHYPRCSFSSKETTHQLHHISIPSIVKTSIHSCQQQLHTTSKALSREISQLGRQVGTTRIQMIMDVDRILRKFFMMCDSPASSTASCPNWTQADHTTCWISEHTVTGCVTRCFAQGYSEHVKRMPLHPS